MKRRGRPGKPPGERMDRTLGYAVRQDEYDAVKRACRERGVTPSAAARAAVMAWVNRKATPEFPTADPVAERLKAVNPWFNQLARAGNVLNQQLQELRHCGLSPSLTAEIIEALRKTRAVLKKIERMLAGLTTPWSP